MSIRRRTLLAVLAPLLSGCELRPNPDVTPTTSTPRTTTDRRTTERGGESAGGRTASTPRRTVGSVTLVNDADVDRYATVAVESEVETHLVESRTVRGGTAVAFDGVVPATGAYRVVVDTASGSRDAFDWRITETIEALRIRLLDGSNGSDGVTFSRPLSCDPDCADVALGGTATGYPEGGFDPRGRRAGTELRVHNVARGARTIRVRVDDGAILDYRYRIPPAVSLTIPVPQRSGETVVEIRVEGEPARAFQWRMEREPVRRVTVGPPG